jgi:hypothetical protein
VTDSTIVLPEIRSSSAQSFYYGGDREGWHIALSVNRDSDAIDRSNWEIITAAVLAIPDDAPHTSHNRVDRGGYRYSEIWFCNRCGCESTHPALTEIGQKICEQCQSEELAGAATERMSHFLCGWVDHLLVRPGSSAEAEALRWREKLESYPVADEEHYSDLESAEEWCKRCDSATREQHPTGRCAKFRGEYETEEILRRWLDREESRA